MFTYSTDETDNGRGLNLVRVANPHRIEISGVITTDVTRVCVELIDDSPATMSRVSAQLTPMQTEQMIHDLRRALDDLDARKQLAAETDDLTK